MDNYSLAKFSLVSISLPAFQCQTCGKLVSSTMHQCGNTKYDVVLNDKLDNKNG